jgi:hypothetical protein
VAPSKVVPISVAVDKTARDVFAEEARRRGLGVSTTIRVLALERAKEIRKESQLARAWEWQLQRMRDVIAQTERGENPVVDDSEVDRIFDTAIARMRKRQKR